MCLTTSKSVSFQGIFATRNIAKEPYTFSNSCSTWKICFNFGIRKFCKTWKPLHAQSVSHYCFPPSSAISNDRKTILKISKWHQNSITFKFEWHSNYNSNNKSNSNSKCCSWKLELVSNNLWMIVERRGEIYFFYKKLQNPSIITISNWVS